MQQTLHLYASREADVRHAADILRRGGLVAFPTETVYGLGANAHSREAVRRIFEAKGRPSWDPLIVHVPEFERLASVCSVPNEIQERVGVLARAFWPGPLTLLLPRTGWVPDEVTAGRRLVGVRVPADPAAQALLRAVGLPLAAPSANRFGHVSPTTAGHVLTDLSGRIDAVLDAGPCAVGVESTVLDAGQTPMVIYRAGAITGEMLQRVTGVDAVMYEPPRERAGPETLPSPGVGVRHYAPDAEVRLTEGTPEALWGAVRRAVTEGANVGVLVPGDWQMESFAKVEIVRWGRWEDARSLAAGLFAGLRALEDRSVGVIVCPLPEEGDVRDAVRDRLRKAAKAP